MSRRHPGGHKLPENPTWIEFPRSDGDVNHHPKNTTKIVDKEGQVNFMRPIGMEESLAVMWRVSVAVALAARLGMPDGPNYVLKSFPEGYQFFDHQKGPAKTPRHDPYLYGSRNVNRFRSTNEFIPHALWLMTDPTLTRSNCQCRYCTKTPQRVITDNMGLSGRRSASVVAGVPPSISRHPRRRDHEARRQERAAVKPFAAVRRAPKPPKALVGPQQYLVPERDLDIRASFGYLPEQQPRRYRKGELLWCHLYPPIRGRNPNEDISFWPGLVDDYHIKTRPVLVDLPTNGDVDMSHLYAEAADDNPELGAPSDGPSSATQPATAPIEATAKIPWRVEQCYEYKMKLLGTAYAIHLPDEHVLPYLAYRPSDSAILRIREEFQNFLDNVSIDEMDKDLDGRMFSFDPMAPEPPGDEYYEKYKQAVAPYTLGVQIASLVASYWLPTDEWECTFNFPESSPSEAPAPPSAEASSLHSVIQQSMQANANSPSTTAGPSRAPPEQESISTAGRPSRAQPQPPQSVTQVRFQGLWWGTERIWADELVRLKIARCQFAPQGTDCIYPPSGPAPAFLQHLKEHSPEVLATTPPERLGAGERGVFLRLEGLVVVDIPQEDGSFSKECRASGTLYELADYDWQEEAEGGNHANGDKEKGKMREDADVAMSTSEGGNGPRSASQPPPPPSSGPVVSPPEAAPPPIQQASPSGAAVPASTSEETNGLSLQLCHPVLSTPYPLPLPPRGFKFRPILHPGYEAVISLSLISGRYYPLLFEHPLMQPLIAAVSDEKNAENFKHLWALNGISPGVHQSMEPTKWKGSRAIMFQDADMGARAQFRERWEEVKMDRLHPPQASPDGDGDAMVVDSS